MKRNTDNPRDTPRNIKKPNQSINNKKTSTDDKEKLNSSKFDKNTDSIYKRTNDYEIDKRMHAQQYDEQLRQDNLKTERKRLKELASNNQNSTNSIESRNHKQVQKYQKTQEEIVHNVKPYDPLAEDMDNDGVIDRYDMDFRDSNVSYQMPQSVREDTRKIETPTTTNHSRHSSQERIANHIFKSNESRLREDISLNNPQSENISFKKKRRIQKFQKEQESYQTDSYDPLSKDMDNDGVIDRYDMDFRDSSISYQRQNRAITNKRNKEFSKQNRSGDLKSSNPQREDIFKKNQSKLNIESTKELSKKPSIKSKRQIQRFQQGEGKEKQKKDINTSLSKDMDNDGRIDRYDMDFRDSNISHKVLKKDRTNLNKSIVSKSKLAPKLKSEKALLGNIFKTNPSKLDENRLLQDQEKNVSFNNKKRIQKFQKEMKKESSQVEAYDPLSKDMDNDGVIDRYDMDFRDSNISYKSPDVRNKRIKNKRGLETTPQRDEKLRMNYDPDEERTRDKKKKTKKEKIKKASKDEKSMSIDGIDRDKIKDDLVVDLKTNKNKKLKSNQQKFKDKKKKGFNPKKKDSKEIPSGLKKKAIDGKLDKSIILLSSMATNYMESGKEDNVAIDASTKVSSGIGKLSGKLRNHKLNKAFKIEKKRKKFENKVKKKERKTLYKSRIEAFKKTEEYEKSSRIHRFFKKKRIKRQLSKKHRESIFKRVKKSTIGSLKKVASLIEKKNKSMALIVLTCLGLFFMLFQTGSNMGSMITGVSGNVLATTYLSDESVLSDVVNEFSSYEYALQDEMESIETNYPGYDEYHVTGDTVGHENHELLSFLTARYGEIKSVDEIKKELKTLFNKMYKKEYTTRNIIKYDEEGNSYIYRIITLNIQKRNIDEIAREEFRGHETNLAHYLTLLESKGNMEAVFGSGNGDLSEIINNPNFGNPGIAFDDETVKQLFQEADKHIGKRYDFGANGPRNFDCSSFVCWSFTHSGVKNMPRTTAWGIYKDYCNPISPSEAKAGDIIFFQGTYNSGSPISHVGIYAGNGIMVHAGDPIKYVSINTPYWREHFYGFGRVK